MCKRMRNHAKRNNELEEILLINYLNHKSLKIDKFDKSWMKNSIFPLSLSLFDTIGLCSIISQSRSLHRLSSKLRKG